MAEGTADRRRRFEAEALGFTHALYRTAVSLMRSTDAAHDLVQETYLRAYRAFGQYAPGTNCKAWLFSIMYSIFKTAYRKAQREQDGMLGVALEAQIEQSLRQDAEFEGDDPARLDWADADVERALRDLPEEFRSVVLIVDVGELSYEEAALALACPVGTVRSRLFRARKLLFAALQGYASRMGYVAAPGRG